MKSSTPSQTGSPLNAFTLIELLVVIAVIGLLAALLFPVMQNVGERRAIAVAYSELGQISAGIEAYKVRKGFYPRDNPANVLLSPLYYELMGTTITKPAASYVYTTLDGTAQIDSATLLTAFNASSLANASTSARGTDDAQAPESFLKDLGTDQVGTVSGVRVLVCSEGYNKPGVASSLAPWAYNSSHPTNNPGSYDLWVDLYLRGKTNRIGNWSKKQKVL